MKHNIIIFESNPLYQILLEIKNNFLFEIKSLTLRDLNKADLTNSIILSKIIHKDYSYVCRIQGHAPIANSDIPVFENHHQLPFPPLLKHTIMLI